MRLEPVLREAQKRIAPTPEEAKKLAAMIERAKSAVAAALPKSGPVPPNRLAVLLTGSYTRNTWMRHKKEFDLFIAFPAETPRETLEAQGLAIGKRTAQRLRGRAVTAYAEHPYTRLSVGGYSVDVVPCYAVDSAQSIKSAVDRTPFHNAWLAKRLPPRLADDVRLLKQLTTAAGLYGSDTRTQGFSGYLCELLIVSANGFAPLLRRAASWNPGEVVVDLEGTRPDTTALRKQFHGHPLVVVDPVDPNRNVAAALSPETFVRFVSACAAFLKKPALAAFFPAPAKPALPELRRELGRRGTRFLVVRSPRPDVIDDTLWPQLRKSASRLAAILEEYEFKTLSNAAYADEKQCLLLVELEVWELPPLRKALGPTVFAKAHVSEFLKKYRPLGRCYVEGDRWVAEVPRRWQRAAQKLDDSLSDPASGLQAKGLGSTLAPTLAKKHELLDNAGLLRLAARDAAVAQWLRHLLLRDIR